MIAVEYDLSTGQIVWRIASSTPFDEYPTRDGYGLIDGDHNPSTHYIDITADPPVVIERPVQSTTLAGNALTNLPIPATLYINNEAYAIDDGEAELNILLPGTYRLRVESWPYQDWECEVTV